MNTKEQRLQTRKQYIPTNATMYLIPAELNAEIYLSDKPNHYSLLAFSGNRGKPDLNFYYKTSEQRHERILAYLDNLQAHYEYHQKQKSLNKPLSTAAQCAKAIRIELNQTFPDTKFSVKSSNFSMGNSVDIYWFDGPSSKAVREITDKYQEGHFDGMNDIYEYSNSRNDIPQTKYVSLHAQISDTLRETIKQRLAEQYGIDMDNHADVLHTFNESLNTVIWREFNNTLLPLK